MSRRTTWNPIQRTRTLSVLHALGVITWRSFGSTPAVCRTAFSDGVRAAGHRFRFLSRWQPYFVAALAAVMVALVASSRHPSCAGMRPRAERGSRLAGGVLVKATGAGVCRSRLLRALGVLCHPARSVRNHVVRLRVCGGISRHHLRATAWAGFGCPRRSRAQPGAVAALLNNCRCRQFCWMPKRMKSFVSARPRWRSFSAVKNRSLVETSSRPSFLLSEAVQRLVDGAVAWNDRACFVGRSTARHRGARGARRAGGRRLPWC